MRIQTMLCAILISGCGGSSEPNQTTTTTSGTTGESTSGSATNGGTGGGSTTSGSTNGSTGSATGGGTTGDGTTSGSTTTTTTTTTGIGGSSSTTGESTTGGSTTGGSTTGGSTTGGSTTGGSTTGGSTTGGSTTGGSTPLELRSVTGDSAHLRYFDFQQLGTSVVSKICVFGDDGDPRPYAVLADHSHADSEAQYSAAAAYVTVPAGVALKLQHLLSVASNLDTTTAGCDVTAAQALPALPGKSAAPLVANHYYTTAITPDSFFSYCSSNTTQGCGFYPQPSASSTNADCAPKNGQYLFEDGAASGFRIINLTTNSATISVSQAGGAYTDIYHPSTGITTNASYHDASGTTLRFCPFYLTICPGMDTVAAWDVMIACADGSGWQVASADVPRITTTNTATTVYVVGQGKFLYDGTLHGASAQLVIANDVSDGPLP
jgi:hypothetical protein